MDFEYVLIVIGIIVAAVLLYYGFIRFIKNKNLKTNIVSSIHVDELIDALGGKENIRDVRSTPSKLTVTVIQHDMIDIETIKALGASGIVEGKDTVSMIFGKQSPLIEEDLKNIL